MDKLRKIVSVYNGIEKWFLVIMTFSMVCVIFAQVFTRYVMGHALFWSEETGKYIFVWISWIGVSAGMIKDEHIRVTIVLKALEKRGHKKIKESIDLLGNLVWLSTSVVIVIFGMKLLLLQKMSGVYGAATGIPTWIMYIVLPLSGILVCLRLIPIIYNNIQHLRGIEVKEVI